MIFDNTLRTAEQASTAEAMRIITDIEKGNQAAKFKAGQIVRSSAASPYNFTGGQIADFYTVNGYYYYNVSVTGGGGKKTVLTLRQSDIAEG